MKFFIILLLFLNALTIRAESSFLDGCQSVVIKKNLNPHQVKQITWLNKIFKTKECQKIHRKLQTLRSFNEIIPTERGLFDSRAFKPFELKANRLSENIELSQLDSIRKDFTNLELFKEFSNITHYVYMGDESNNLCQTLSQVPSVNTITILNLEDDEVIKCIKDRDIKVYVFGKYMPTSSSLEISKNLHGIESYEGNIEDLFQYKNLSYLGLEKFTGDSTLKVLADNRNLKSLHVNLNNIHNIEELSALPYLSFLSMRCSGNKLKSNCKNKSLKNIEFLKELIFLKGLDLSKNQIEDLSPISSMSELEYLDVRSNKIKHLPNLSKVSKLKFLDLASNHINKISELKKTAKLQYLNLNDNQISELNDLSFLEDLKYLSLGSNPIADIGALKPPKKLKLLDLNSLKHSIRNTSASFRMDLLLIAKNSSEIEWLERIINRDESYTFQSIKEESQIYSGSLNLDKYKNLEVLSLANTEFHNITNAHKLKKLKYLDLSNSKSPINYLSESIQHLSLRNSISKLESMSLRNLQGLKYLDLSETMLVTSQLNFNFPELEFLFLAKNNLHATPNLSQLKKLILLDLSKNLILEFNQNLPSLGFLNLAENKFTEMPDISKYSLLTDAYFDSNQIENINSIFEKKLVSKNVAINLDDNRITDLSAFKVFAISSIFLQLTNNPITKENCPKDALNFSVALFCESSF